MYELPKDASHRDRLRLESLKKVPVEVTNQRTENDYMRKCSTFKDAQYIGIILLEAGRKFLYQSILAISLSRQWKSVYTFEHDHQFNTVKCNLKQISISHTVHYSDP